MYTYIGLSLLGIAALLASPFGVLDASSDGKFYGLSTMIVYDANGQETMRSIIHNQVTNQGEEYLLDQVFQESGNLAAADTAQIGSICIAEGTISEAETTTASTFDSANTIVLTSVANCIEADVNVGGNDGTAVIGPLTFQDDVHLVTGDAVNGIGICSANAGTTPYDNCAAGAASNGVLFAVIDTNDVTINAGESVQITYTFDISSATT